MTDKAPEKRGPIPLPRLKHIQPGQFFTLIHESTPRLLLSKSDRYGHFDDGRASLCHEVRAENMKFGEGGWRVSE
ncbi:hypothetical protein [Alcaligenes endophyticus]|uniref:Uncharacterized protein n=1 Tax=Alcaligenes endophyticus TaxID=1929088 RepID=A0ABT8EIU3_9BURK|nr:hypothetical protein [Alcaligenes endophyticus]MCX5592483.1 hypothetical protein [Alcaligenes endophyticus]MDN4121208.1 hypothetical protein [Alcaligenes endophyticus]